MSSDYVRLTKLSAELEGVVKRLDEINESIARMMDAGALRRKELLKNQTKLRNLRKRYIDEIKCIKRRSCRNVTRHGQKARYADAVKLNSTNTKLSVWTIGQGKKR